MMLAYGIFSPHPPVIIPAVGGEFVRRFEKTINSLLAVSLTLREGEIDTFVILTPHTEIQPDQFTIRVPKADQFTANFAEFSAPKTILNFARDRLFTARIIEATNSTGLRIEPIDDFQLDFGTSVPLFYLASGLPQVEIVSLGVSLAGAPEHYRLGRIIREIADNSEKKIAFIASGELSHKLFKNSPHGFNPAAAEWDKKIIQNLQVGNYENILNQDPFELDEIGECGFRSLATLIGAFDGIKETHKILSYEAPAGIGCAVGIWKTN